MSFHGNTCAKLPWHAYCGSKCKLSFICPKRDFSVFFFHGWRPMTGADESLLADGDWHSMCLCLKFIWVSVMSVKNTVVAGLSETSLWCCSLGIFDDSSPHPRHNSQSSPLTYPCPEVITHEHGRRGGRTVDGAEGDRAEWILLLAPQATECCLTQGSITIWTMPAAKCVFLVHVCVSVCLHRRITITPQQLLFLVVHFHLVCHVTQTDTTA